MTTVFTGDRRQGRSMDDICSCGNICLGRSWDNEVSSDSMVSLWRTMLLFSVSAYDFTSKFNLYTLHIHELFIAHFFNPAVVLVARAA